MLRYLNNLRFFKSFTFWKKIRFFKTGGRIRIYGQSYQNSKLSSSLLWVLGPDWIRSLCVLSEQKSFLSTAVHQGSPGGSIGQESACNAGDLGLLSGSWRTPGEGNGYPLQYSCSESPMDSKEPSGLQSMGSQRVRHDWVTFTSLHRLIRAWEAQFLNGRMAGDI